MVAERGPQHHEIRTPTERSGSGIPAGHDRASLASTSSPSPVDGAKAALQQYISTDRLGDVTRSMAATFAANALERAEELGVFDEPMQVYQSPARTKETRLPQAERVARTLYTEIATGTIGDKIPSEGELCERYDVGRSSLREGLDRLETGGVIETQQGSGRVVTNRHNIPGKEKDDENSWVYKRFLRNS